MRIGNHPHGGKWPHCLGTFDAVKVEDNLYEFRFPVPIPHKLWEERARWPINGWYWKQYQNENTKVEPVVVDGYVEKIAIHGKVYSHHQLELDLSSPGEPMEPYKYSGDTMSREARILDSITPDEFDVEPGTCWYCHEEVPEDAEECPECEVKLSRDAPTVGELVEKYGPNAVVFVYFHDRDVSLNVRYTLDDEGLAKEKAEKHAKYDAEMAEYKLLKAEWDELEAKVNAYNKAKNEADERAKLAELQAKYADG